MKARYRRWWIQFLADWWPAVADHLPQPWPDEAACFDLRWHLDQGGRVPSRRVLSRRWGWTEHRVRARLRDEESWAVPGAPGDVVPVTQEAPASRPRAQGATNTLPGRPPGRRPASAAHPPSDLHRRADQDRDLRSNRAPPDPQRGSGHYDPRILEVVIGLARADDWAPQELLDPSGHDRDEVRLAVKAAGLSGRRRWLELAMRDAGLQLFQEAHGEAEADVTINPGTPAHR